jgi:Transposase DDE domain
VRACYDRRLDASASHSEPGEKLYEFMARAEVRATREVKLSRRKRAMAGGTSKRQAPRSPRIATLVFVARRVVIRRPTRALDTTSPSMSVNVVSVREKDAPPDVEPIDWILLTSEPIETQAQILEVVDAYRARWVIEEYFQSLKTGCAFEQRQLETKKTILNALALFTPVAWALLRMRTLSRSAERSPIGAVLSTTQIKILKNETGIPLRKNSSVADGCLAVARLGGHIKNNGPPGWRVLGRGYDRLLTLEIGYNIRRNE